MRYNNGQGEAYHLQKARKHMHNAHYDGYVIGLDMGTQGARAVAVASDGTVVVRAEEALPSNALRTGPNGVFEQDAEEWWRVTCDALQHIGEMLKALAIPADAVQALCISGTSGTFVPLDTAHHPLRRAFMYSDGRATAEAKRCNAVLAHLTEKLGYRMNSSFALPKLLWLREHEPELWDRTALIAHQADYLVGRLTGVWSVSDYTNVLKTGYDLLAECYPPQIDQELDIAVDRLPRVIAPGTPLGCIDASLASTLGLSSRTQVVAGLTDGCASQFAAGATEVGAWVTSLGTTLTIKGTSAELVKDPQGRIYCHRHPTHGWLPGGASNTGGEILARRFPNADLTAYNERASIRAPTSLIVYPLVRHGERFPFTVPDAEGFLIGATDVSHLPADLYYTACLEGVAYVERLAYEVATELGAAVEGPIRTVGGATRSPLWLQIRASVCNRPFVVPTVGDPAMGTAVLAAAGRLHSDLDSAAQAMVHMKDEVMPNADWIAIYEERYEGFKAALQVRGYI